MATKEEELQELAELEELASLDAQAEQSEASGSWEEEGEVGTSETEAFIRGATDVASFNYADEIGAAFSTAGDYLSGETEYTSFEDLSNTYNKELAESREEYKQNKVDHPSSYFKGQITGAGASMLIPGGAVVKGATAGAKLLKASRVGAVYGGFAGFGQSENKMSLEGALDVAKGALVGAGGGVVAGAVVPVAGAALGGAVKGTGKAIKGSKDLVKKGIGALTGDKYVPTPQLSEAKNLLQMAFKGIGLHTEPSRIKFAKDLKVKGIDPMKWLKRMSKETDVNGNRLIGDLGEDYASIYNKTRGKIGQYADARDDILLSVKEQFNRQEVANSLKRAMVATKKVSPKDAKTVNSMIDDAIIYKTGMAKKGGGVEDVAVAVHDTPLDAMGLSTIRKNLSEHTAFKEINAAYDVKRNFYRALNDITDNAVKKNLGPEVAAKHTGLRSKMSDLMSLQDSLLKGQAHEKFGDMGMFKDVVAATHAEKATQFLNLGERLRNTVASTAIALRHMQASPGINRYRAFNAGRMGEAMERMSESAARRILVTADHDDISVFNTAVAAGVADADMRAAPLPRTAEAAIERQDSIMALVNEHSPDFAPSIQKAFESENPEAIGAIMSQLADLPKAQGLIQEGVGFDGKVYSPEDKAILETQLKSADIPAAQRIQMLNALRKNGIIPQMDQVVQPPQKVHIPKKKKQHDY